MRGVVCGRVVTLVVLALLGALVSASPGHAATKPWSGTWLGGGETNLHGGTFGLQFDVTKRKVVENAVFERLKFRCDVAGTFITMTVPRWRLDDEDRLERARNGWWRFVLKDTMQRSVGSGTFRYRAKLKGRLKLSNPKKRRAGLGSLKVSERSFCPVEEAPSFGWDAQR